jgi:predicted membrane protein
MADQGNFSEQQSTGGRWLSGQRLFGLFFIFIGVGFLLRRLDIGIPQWLFGWETLLILIGLYTGINNRFRDFSWMIPILIGLAFLLDDILPDLNLRRIIWPVGMILIGAVALMGGGRFKRSRNRHRSLAEEVRTAIIGSRQAGLSDGESDQSQQDWLEATAVFGGVKRTIVSKRFQGGEVTSIFGGAEINLAYADIQGVIKLEIVNVLGGTKLVVPAHWDVQSRMSAILGGVEDKRNIRPEQIDPTRCLIIEGTSLLGGLEIRSF